jgi:two-component system response regulator PilR (NtrC family)
VACTIEVDLPGSGIDLEQHLEELRRHFMREAMRRSGGVQTRAAEVLGMTFRSFRYFAKKYGLSREDCVAEGRSEELTGQTERVG